MKTLIKILLLLFITTNISAQDADSVAFSNFKWTKTRIAKKTKAYNYHVSDSGLFNANQYISFVEVKNKRKAPGFAIGYHETQLIKTSAFGNSHAAIAAVNGTFFDVKNGGSVDFIKVNDTVINQNRIGKTRALHQKAAVVINNNVLEIKRWNGLADWEDTLTDKNVMVSGPLLVLNDQKEKLDSVPFNRLRHPRTAVGVKPDGTVILLTVDGRQKNAAGMNLFELAKIMKWLGCSSAINLDGGGSTTLWVANYGENGVVNHPSDNKKWDHNGERRVANVILVKQKTKQ